MSRKVTFRVTRILSALVLLMGVSALAPASATEATSEKERRGSIRITSDAGFTPENGIRTGSGTKDDPYVISDWSLSSITIADTGKYLVVRDNVITGTLRLNWNGDRLKVVNNEIGDLRVNENVKRTGDMTSGRIANNKIGVVGQLRHWDGVFENNVVGDPGAMNLPFFADRAVNFDGFNGARFRNNTVYGYVDVRLHGHHHGSGFGEGHSHDHSEMGHYGHEMMDHTQRYHQVWVTGNTIYAPGSYYALRYYDVGHAANDRTANSEPNPELNKPHVHYTRVHLNDNELYGGLEVDIFNAKDELHREFARGRVNIKGNKILLTRDTTDRFEGRDGISVFSARYLRLDIINNEVRADFSGDATDNTIFHRGEAGIRLDDLDQADVYLAGNSIFDVGYGIYARRMTETVNWQISRFRTGNVEQDLYYDNSVANEPQRRS